MRPARRFATLLGGYQLAKSALLFHIAGMSVSRRKPMQGRHPCTCGFRNTPGTVVFGD